MSPHMSTHMSTYICIVLDKVWAAMAQEARDSLKTAQELAQADLLPAIDTHNALRASASTGGWHSSMRLPRLARSNDGVTPPGSGVTPPGSGVTPPGSAGVEKQILMELEERMQDLEQAQDELTAEYARAKAAALKV